MENPAIDPLAVHSSTADNISVDGSCFFETKLREWIDFFGSNSLNLNRRNVGSLKFVYKLMLGEVESCKLCQATFPFFVVDVIV